MPTKLHHVQSILGVLQTLFEENTSKAPASHQFSLNMSDERWASDSSRKNFPTGAGFDVLAHSPQQKKRSQSTSTRSLSSEILRRYCVSRHTLRCSPHVLLRLVRRWTRQAQHWHRNLLRVRGRRGPSSSSKAQDRGKA